MSTRHTHTLSHTHEEKLLDRSSPKTLPKEEVWQASIAADFVSFLSLAENNIKRTSTVHDTINVSETL
eukprot:3462335-Amphidinium_carterae.1